MFSIVLLRFSGTDHCEHVEVWKSHVEFFRAACRHYMSESVAFQQLLSWLAALLVAEAMSPSDGQMSDAS